jgi:hypothetical protein
VSKVSDLHQTLVLFDREKLFFPKDLKPLWQLK